MPKFIDRTGEVYGDWTVVARANNNPRGGAMRWCRCKCGKYALVSGGHLQSGYSKSCRYCAHITHGGNADPLYPTHYGMMQRCYNPKSESYPYYGARGIKVCDEWHICTNFYKWAYANGYEPGLSLDRINRDGDYCPENCRWATDEEQANNKSNNLVLTIGGKTQTLAQHFKDPEINIYDLKEKTVRERIRCGWPAEKAFSTPKGCKRSRRRAC